MQVVADANGAGDLPSGSIVTIGNYDGIHLGQRAVLERVVERASELGLVSVAVTFDPHPLAVLRPESAPLRLTTAEQKQALLEEIGLDFLLIIAFTEDFARTSAREFVTEMLHRRLSAREIYVGSRFAFGHQRQGNLALLQELGAELGFQALAVDEVRVGGERVSSSQIRDLVRSGQTERVRERLGRPYALTGVIARGDRMGQRLGWPTINLRSDNELIPGEGVYSTRVFFPRLPATFDSVTNIGTRPTVYENYDRVVESHILDFRSDVYGERIELSFFHRLREERLFQSTMELSAQIGRDVEVSREYFRTLREKDETYTL